MRSQPFEDLLEGATFTTAARTITEADVLAFAEQTGDRHPQHVDAAWAADSRFGEQIAHGMLVLSCAVGLLEFDPERVVALRRLSDVVFKRPVRLGDTVRAQARVAGLSAVTDEAGLVGLDLRIVNQHDELVCRARAEVLWKRDAFVAIPL